MYRVTFYVFNSILLLLFSFYLTISPVFIEPTIQVMKTITNPIKELINTYILEGIYYNPLILNNDFILIDTSSSLELINKTDDSDGEPATNRNKLTQLFDMLCENLDNVSVIVCDIKLQDEILKNHKLLNSVQNISSDDNKIILITNEKNDKSAAINSLRILTGWVNYDLAEGYIFHTPLKNNGELTLPYLLYSRVKGVRYQDSPFTSYVAYEIKGDNSFDIIFPSFVPEMYFFDEDLFSKTSALEKNSQKHNWLTRILGIEPINSDSLSVNKNYVFNLNNLLNNQDFFNDLIAAHKKPIIFIGGFKQQEIDIHSTAFGQMHGSLILINIYNALLNGQHKISKLYILFLLLSFFFLSRLALNKPLKSYQDSLLPLNAPQLKDRSNTYLSKYSVYKSWKAFKKYIRKKVKSNKLVALIQGNSFLMYMYMIFESIMEFLFDNKIYLTLLIIVLLSDIFFNHVLNILGLAIYFLVLTNFISKIISFEISNTPK